MSTDLLLRLYRFPLSGHAHRAELFLSLLDLRADLIDVDLPGGEHKTEAFLAKNAFGQVPVLEDGDLNIADSAAILVYLALRYDPSRQWYPGEPAAAAVQRWLSVAAGQLAAGPGAARLAALFGAPIDVARARQIAGDLFARLEDHLTRSPFLVESRPTIADIAMYTYTAHAPEGGIPLDPYPRVNAWLERIEALPSFVPMKRS